MSYKPNKPLDRKLFLLESGLNEDMLESNRAAGRIPVAVITSGCLEGGDPIDFYNWDELINQSGLPIPPLGYVVQSVGLSTNQAIVECKKDCIRYIPHNVTARHYQTGETCELKGRFSEKKKKYFYNWFNRQGQKVSF